MAEDVILSSLIEHFELKEQCNEPISSLHLNEIALSYCAKWRFLPPPLGLEYIAAQDIDRGTGNEEDKRLAFFLKWKHAKGPKATYRRLIEALLAIKCRADAEGVCKLLASSKDPQKQQEVVRQTSNEPLPQTHWRKWIYMGIGCCILASFIGFYFPNKSFVADIKVDAQSSAAKIPSIKQITKTTDATKPSSQIPNRIVSTTSSKKTITTTSLKTTPTNSPKVPRKPATVGKATKAMDTSKHAANAPKVAAKPIPKADAAFSASDEKTKDTSGHTASPSQSSTRKGCYAEIDLKEAMEGKESMAVLQFTSTDSQSCDLSNDSLACELVSEITGTKVTCKVNFIENGKYELTYLPTVKGRHKFHVSVDNQHIGGSPYGVTVLKSPNKALGDPLLTIAGVDRPRGVAIAKNGEIIVTEEGRNRVSIFSPGGQKLRSFGTYGSGNGKFSSLRGVAVDKAGEILVVDKFNFHIQKFTMNGEFIRAVGTDGMGFIISEQFFLSSDVESKNTKVYVLDKLNNIVQTLDTDLISLHPIGKKGKSDLRQYTHPLGISHATTGEIYVTSFDYHEVLVFAPDGKFLNRFGRDKSYPGLKGVMDWPNGIAVGNDGVVYVSENKSNRVKMYSLKGQLLGSFGTYGEDPGEFDHPRGLAVDSAGVLYVCDSGNNRIQVF